MATSTSCPNKETTEHPDCGGKSGDWTRTRQCCEDVDLSRLGDLKCDPAPAPCDPAVGDPVVFTVGGSRVLGTYTAASSRTAFDCAGCAPAYAYRATPWVLQGLGTSGE